jgi:putative aminopeptidase FrvX
METLQLLESLCTAHGVSGSEHAAAEVAMNALKPYAESVWSDDYANVYAHIRSAKEGEPTLLLEAHLDEIGLVVTGITADGFLKVAACGGIDRRLLLAQEVLVLGKEPISGIVSTIPPHLSDGGEDKAPEVSDISIDIGCTKEEAEQLVEPGDVVVFPSGFHVLSETRVSSKALDDRSGCAAILIALERLKDAKLSCGLDVLFSVQEEVGLRGAKMGGWNCHPDCAISVDVSFATTPDAKPYTTFPLGEGALIGRSPFLSKSVTNRLIELAKEEQIPYHLEVMGGSTGTNADALQVIRGGVSAGLVSIPQRYMHTPVEMIDLRDLDAVANLLAAYAKTYGGCAK